MNIQSNCTLLLYIPLFQQLLGAVSSLTWAISTVRAGLTTVLALCLLHHWHTGKKLTAVATMDDQACN
jgi:hypothetical protein